MKIHWAVFGEHNRGHALLAASGNREFAARLTQYTDRPGDPPMGIEWGPVHSGFYFADHFVLLRTLPDPGAGRAGMVRSYAAYVPLSELQFIKSLLAIFNQLPSGLEKTASNLDPLEVSPYSPCDVHVDKLPGLFQIAKQLGSSAATLPMIWASDEPYLPTVDALWSRLPSTLRPSFTFAFQFAPEHKMPNAPTLVATLPSLAGRWETGSVIRTDINEQGNLNTIQSWFAGLSDGTAFERLLADYGIEPKSFSELNLLSLFLDLITRLPKLSFMEVLRAIRIVEKHSKTSNAAGKNRQALFAILCELVVTATADEISRLRNLDPDALDDLISPLQGAMREQIQSDNISDGLMENVKTAMTSPGIWWSQPFMDWIMEVSKLATDTDVQIFLRLLASETVPESIMKSIAKDAGTEEKLLNGLPKKIDRKECTILLRLAEDRNWMRLHAECLMRSMSQLEAVKDHVAVAGIMTEGLELFYRRIGFIPLIQAACSTANRNLIEYVSSLLPNHASEISQEFVAKCPIWPSILASCINQINGGLLEPFRSLAISTLGRQKEGSSEFEVLCAACTDRDLTIWFELADAAAILNFLTPQAKELTVLKINTYIADEVKGGRSIKIINPMGFCRILNTEALMLTLASVSPSSAAKAGAAAFRSFPFLSDDDCCRWLIDLFTRTVFYRLEPEETSAVASILLAADYPKAAMIIKDTVENYGRSDITPIFQEIRYKYELAKTYHQKSMVKKSKLTKVLIATALPLERNEVIRHLGTTDYDPELFADVGQWPAENPLFEVYVILTGAGNLQALRGALKVFKSIRPKIALFIGIGGGLKDSNVGDVAYSTKVYYYEGGKEEDDGIKSRPDLEKSSEALVQLAHRVATHAWQPKDNPELTVIPKATPAVFASGEKVLTSMEPKAATFHQIKRSYNDSQIVEMEAYGFLNACREERIGHSIVIRGVSDNVVNKAESDEKGNQPLAAHNAAAFLFALLRCCPDILRPKKKKRFLGIL